ncbi:MAG: SAM-dependent chlorinase/fluorinase [Desulfovibrionaceae bacterium]|nr:SAM-dependent chlorinase/fluorinase [Desulfovibrionaceae bacterium]MBF0514272.1 SAM-dependent chlorinase/fluorinase [Desulfovibrionaceae bacterium]
MIALITDFGLADPYVGQMKGAILAGAPGALIVDITHMVEPHNVAQAGFFLAASLGSFPKGTIFAAVVDPGVGSERRIVGVSKRGRILLAPDNGLLGLALRGPGAVEAFDLTPASDAAASATFHGRDVFAPLAALLDSGEELASLGQGIDPSTLAPGAVSEAKNTGNTWLAHVLHIDRFGDCVLDIASDARLPVSGGAMLTRPASFVIELARNYESLGYGRIGLICGSQGFYELAVNQGSAAEVLGLALGDEVELILAGEPARP